jgi:tRNA-specific 2-thiouridylase
LIWPGSKCCSPPVLKRAEDLCRKLGIPYIIIDLVSPFTSRVVDDFAEAYLSGMTPNPCIRCNERIRFTLFYRRLKEKLASEGQLQKGQELFFATGHYASIVEQEGRRFIRKGKDRSKDQSYMLYRIPVEMLEYIIFPLGDYNKKEIFRQAQERELPGGVIKESQDICFVDDDYVSFLERYSDKSPLAEPGRIVDMKRNDLGEHRGYIHYTIGQRKGLNLGNGPWYVAAVKPAENLVVVGRQDEVTSREFTVEQNNWFCDPPENEYAWKVKIRYNSPEIPCRVTGAADGGVRVFLEQPAVITPGQSAVFYLEDIVMGGGIICAPS